MKSAALVEVVRHGSALEELASATRAWVRAEIHQHVGREHPTSAAIAISILIGDRTGLSDEDERRLQDAGTYHVIAISGGNIAILTAVLVFVARASRVHYRVAAAGVHSHPAVLRARSPADRRPYRAPSPPRWSFCAR